MRGPQPRNTIRWDLTPSERLSALLSGPGRPLGPLPCGALEATARLLPAGGPAPDPNDTVTAFLPTWARPVTRLEKLDKLGASREEAISLSSASRKLVVS